ncbi:MAG: M67 family metallopeptidase [candidate division FCPU426 bacterium]
MLRLRRSQIESIHAHATTEYPHECCGIFLGKRGDSGDLVEECRRATNIEPERAADRYLIDPAALLRAEKDARAQGLEVLGYYHSHPDHPALASATDSARSWEGYAYMILSVQSGRPAEMACYVRDPSSEAPRLIPQDFVVIP